MAKKSNIIPFKNRVYLSSPTMHGDELKYMQEAFETNWMSTIGKNIDEVERIAAEKAGVKYAVGLCNCTAALHLACRIAGEKLYGKPKTSHGSLEGKKVFCSDMTFAATVNPVVYEGGEPIFIDTDINTWNMDPKCLEKAFELYPDVKLVVYAELYGFPGRVDLIRDIAHKHGALLIEDAAEAMGASINGQQCGSFGDYAAISYNGNKIITGSSGGCFLTNSKKDADHVRKLSTQAREPAPWYQHEEIGYNYRMSNVIAGVVRGQYPYLEEHISQKKRIYEKYKEGLKNLPIKMNPIVEGSNPNYWLSAFVIDDEFLSNEIRKDNCSVFKTVNGKTCPGEILEAISELNAEGRPIWKPMHLEPTYENNAFVCLKDDVGSYIFKHGLCLPSDNKMSFETQKIIVKNIKNVFIKGR